MVTAYSSIISKMGPQTLRTAHLVDEVGQVLHPVLLVVFHPLDHGLKDVLLCRNAQLVAGDQLDDFAAPGGHGVHRMTGDKGTRTCTYM